MQLTRLELQLTSICLSSNLPMFGLGNAPAVLSGMLASRLVAFKSIMSKVTALACGAIPYEGWNPPIDFGMGGGLTALVQ